MNEITHLMLLVGIILLFFLTRITYSAKERKKKYYIGKAEKVIKRLESFQGDMREARCLSYLRKINPYVFEELILTAFQTKGFTIERNTSYSHDGGIDGKLFQENKTILIQAKRYSSYIQAKHIKDFEQLIAGSGVHKGYFIHTGKTSKEMLNRYRNGKIQIISGHLLIELILTSQKEKV